VVMHTHNFTATDIPAVCLCKCGVERYYARELQTYIIVGEGESDDVDTVSWSSSNPTGEVR